MDKIYEQLAFHLAVLGMGMPDREELREILEHTLTPREAEIALLFPTKVAPLTVASVEEIVGQTDLCQQEVEQILETIARKGLLFTGKTASGEKGYSLHQLGYGFPQSFFWKGENTPEANAMAGMLGKYLNRQVIREGYAGSATKPFRYVPLEGAIDHEIQAVYPSHMIKGIVEQGTVFAVSHCPCRMIMQLRGKGCEHPLEVCLKFDEMAEYLIDRGLGRQISKEEALAIIEDSAKAGLVHFVDNAAGPVKHICNCCGCACWNVGTIKRRKIPRDVLMATYFLRRTDENQCTACGDCVEVCPVDVLSTETGTVVVDEEWCIGCGVCVPQCSEGAAQLKLRTDTNTELLDSFEELHRQILKEKDLI